MIKVYFETKGYAEHVATFNSEDMYVKLLPALKQQAKDSGYDIVTEEDYPDYLHNASYYLSEFESTIEEQVNAIKQHENQYDLIDVVECVWPWNPLQGRFTCIEFLELIGHN